jgi:hypothetical protein
MFHKKGFNIDPLTMDLNYLFGDIILFLSLLEVGKVRCLPSELSVYRVHHGGMSVNKSSDFSLKFIKHHLTIQRNFGGKYLHVTDGLIASVYKSLGKIEIKKLKILTGV